MYLRKVNGPRVVTLPDGSTLSLADLPKPDTTRWVARRKAAVAKAVMFGLLEWSEAKKRYSLSEEELKSWVATQARHGEAGLKLSVQLRAGRQRSAQPAAPGKDTRSSR